jgi:putative membrane protein
MNYQLIRPTRINLEIALKMIILIGFAFFFAMIVHSGQVRLYVHPRLIPYIEFSTTGLILMTVFSVHGIRQQ